ncbi:UTP--glucose-1-phosphate uridylyltransferase [Nymphon striatum]|nr:UTP--glucose-1-phosphate uridylyltransferase [Nymphon striatum]
MGTRFLPATKSIPKEMLPLVDRPLIQYAVDEARKAGIEEFIFVSAAGKGALEDYFDTAAALEMQLKAKGKTEALEALAPTRMPEGALTILRQAQPLGLGHAVRQAKRRIAVKAVTWSPRWRCPAPPFHLTADVSQQKGRIALARGLVEKPRPEIAPSTQAIVGRYILEPSIFERLDALGPGAGGELQLTDAINADVQTAGVTGYRFDGERFDCGSVQGFVQATAAFAMAHSDLGAGFMAFMETRKSHLKMVS